MRTPHWLNRYAPTSSRRHAIAFLNRRGAFRLEAKQAGGAIASDELAVEDGRVGRQFAQHVRDDVDPGREVMPVAGEDGDVLAHLVDLDAVAVELTIGLQGR